MPTPCHALTHSPEDLEAEVREFLVELMPIEHAPSHLRLAFHDAGTMTAPAGTGAPHGTVHLTDELRRADNTGWGQACMELLARPSPPTRGCRGRT